MTYAEWVRTVPEEFKGDAVWNVEAYRLGLFLSDLAWVDCGKMKSDLRTRSLIGQLYRSVGSISATISEGFSKTTGKERARFYEFALGSARESRDWYYEVRHVTGPKVTKHRLDLATQFIRLTLKMIPDQRTSNRKLSVTLPRKSRNHVIT